MAIDNRAVGKNIAAMRMHAGMTQQQLAGALNVSHQAVSKWENGAAVPDIQTLLELTQMFGVSMEQLLNGEIAFEEETFEGEAPSNEPFGLGKWIRDEIGEDTVNALRSATDNARKKLQDFGEIAGKTMNDIGEFAGKTVSDITDKAQDMFHRAVKSSTVRDEGCEAFYEETAEEAQPAPAPQADQTPDAQEHAPIQDAQINFENILSMAPFMSREKLCEIVLRLTSIGDWESVLKIAPFLNRPTVQTLVKRCMDCPADRRVLKRLAPFAGADCLYELILENLSAVDWDTLKSLAPFLQRSMVDALTEYMLTGAMPVREVSQERKKDGFPGAVQTAMDEIGNVVNEIGKAVGGIFASGKKAPAPAECAQSEAEAEFEVQPDAPAPSDAIENRRTENADKAAAPSEMKNRVAKAALLSENWAWINAHLFEIKDTELLCEIAVQAVKSFAGEDNQAIAVRAAAMLNEEERARLFDAIVEERAWEVAVALKNLAGEDAAGKIVKAAAEAKDAERENAYLAIEFFAKIAAKEVLEEITEKALEDKNWLLINALTDAI